MSIHSQSQLQPPTTTTTTTTTDQEPVKPEHVEGSMRLETDKVDSQTKYQDQDQSRDRSHHFNQTHSQLDHLSQSYPHPYPPLTLPHTKTQSHTHTHTQTELHSLSWSIKHIFWPPFPNSHLSLSINSPHRIPIILQNHNGPCSLLAISNILLLNRAISLPPPNNRSSVDFSTLASIIVDYLLSRSIDPLLLASAFESIPSSRTGLDLNPSFTSIHAFRPGNSSKPNGLDLFRAANIPLVHGWLPDPQDNLTSDLLVSKCGDYDKALELLVTAQELNHPPRPSTDLSPTEQTIINDALLIRRFLDSTSTQLSYSGLFQLASGLAPDSLAAFLRNSHLSVLYRRPPRPPPSLAPLPPPPDQIEPGYCHQTMLEVHAVAQQLAAVDLDQPDDDGRLPKLFTLVSDLAFLNEPDIVWESLEDVEGGLSEFYDWKLDKVPLKTRSSRPCVDSDQGLDTSVSGHQQPENTDTDLDLAHQLQEEEYRSTAANRARTHHQPPARVPNLPQPVYPVLTQGTAVHASGPSPNPAPVSSPQGGRGRKEPSSSAGKAKKRDCVVM